MKLNSERIIRVNTAYAATYVLGGAICMMSAFVTSRGAD